MGVLPSDIALTQIGPVGLRPHFSYQYLYATGLQSAPGQASSSVVQQFSPGVLLTLGTHWTLDYSPTLTFYSSTNLHDSLSHNVSLTGGSSYEDWSFNVSQTFSESSDPSVETGAQTDNQSFGTSLGASYRFNSEFSTDMSLSQGISAPDGPGLVDSYSWTFTDYLNYQLFTHFTFGLGATVGYSAVSEGADSLSEQLNARVQWRLSQKSSVEVHGGVEELQYLGGGISTLTPVFGVSISDQLLPNTSLSLTADRSISPSYFANQSSQSTSISASITQQLPKKFSLALTASYNFVDYAATSDTASVTNRNDSSYSLGASLSRPLFKRANASLTYNFNKDNSTGNGFSYSSTQVGVQISYAF